MPTTHGSKTHKYGKGGRQCRRCGARQGLIRKYDLMLCRRCFRENANEIGFFKVCPQPCELED